MKVKLGEIVNSKESLQNLLNTKLPVKTSYALNKLVLQINPELEIYEKKRIEFVKEFGEEQEDKTWKVKEENTQKYFEELNKLLSIEVELDFQKLKIEDLGTIEVEPSKLPLWILE